MSIYSNFLTVFFFLFSNSNSEQTNQSVVNFYHSSTSDIRLLWPSRFHYQKDNN